MFLVGLISWWYGRGWLEQGRRFGDMLSRTLEFFSVGQLAATLFAPFRQISVGVNHGQGLAAAFSAFLDKLVSRCIGAVVRTFTILFGVIFITVQALYGALVMVIWWVVPILPFIGLGLMLIGWVPHG